MTECGLFLSEREFFLGATPDALVSCACCGSGIVEVKCPFCKRHYAIEEAAKDPQFCLETCEGQTKLKADHQYYFQVQCQLYVTQKHYCDFVVYTSPDFKTCQIFVERHTLNKPFINKAVDTCQLFYKQCILPELLGKIFTR